MKICPTNTEFRDLTFIAPWDLYVATQNWVKVALDRRAMGQQFVADPGAD
jgi:hypothetical protein